MNIERTENGEEIILTVEGRVDANTSRELQDAIITAFQAPISLWSTLQRWSMWRVRDCAHCCWDKKRRRQRQAP